MGKAKRSTAWWGEYRFREGETRVWRIGPLGLFVFRGGREWRVAWESHELEQSEEWEALEGVAFPEDAPNVQRFAFAETKAELNILPALANRPIVTSPRIPLCLAPGEQITLYVSSPLWLKILAGRSGPLLFEVPIHRPSDTWFGPSTLEGELCYATRTAAVLEIENILFSCRRAITPVHIQNQTPRSFPVDRLKLPVTLLSIFSSADCQLWTEEVRVTHGEDSGLDQVELQIGSPAESGKGTPVADPREVSQPSMLLRVFSSIFRLDI